MGSKTKTVSTPRQVGIDSDWIKMSIGAFHILAQKACETLRAWGKTLMVSSEMVRQAFV
jgi:hypothetical protein